MLLPCLLLLGTGLSQDGSTSEALRIALAAPAQLFADPADRGLLALVGDGERTFPGKVTALVPLRNLLLQPGLPGVTLAPEDFGTELLEDEAQPLVVITRSGTRIEVGRRGKGLRFEGRFTGEAAGLFADLPTLLPLEPKGLEAFRSEVPLALALRGEQEVPAASSPAKSLTGTRLVVLLPGVEGWQVLWQHEVEEEGDGWWFAREGLGEEPIQRIEAALHGKPVSVPDFPAGPPFALARLDPEPLVELLAADRRAALAEALVEAEDGRWPDARELAAEQGPAWVRIWREAQGLRVSGQLPGSWSRYWPLVEFLAAGRLEVSADSGLARARAAQALADMRTIHQAAQHFQALNGRYPESLEVLVLPDANGERFLDHESVPVDPWGRTYGYAVFEGGAECEVYSLGADGLEGGTGEDADLSLGERP